jgi:hypothetical protein
MKTLYVLSALSAEGLGGIDKYIKIVAAENEAELFALKREFALEYGVDLQMVEDSILVIEGSSTPGKRRTYYFPLKGRQVFPSLY